MLRVEKQGYEPYEQTLVLAANQRRTVRVKLTRASAADDDMVLVPTAERARLEPQQERPGQSEREQWVSLRPVSPPTGCAPGLAMRRAGGLWPRVVGLESLHEAARRVLRGERDREGAACSVCDLESELLGLQRELQSGACRPRSYRSFWIRDPKRRLISAAPFRDRVVHHALVAALEPVFERRFIHHSYACRPGLGNHRALAQFTRCAARSAGASAWSDERGGPASRRSSLPLAELPQRSRNRRRGTMRRRGPRTGFESSSRG